jgi:hypothetical protein
LSPRWAGRWPDRFIRIALRVSVTAPDLVDDHFVISNVVPSSAVESPPTQTSKVDGSVTQSRTAAFQYRRSAGPTGNETVRDSPAARVTRWNPLSSRTGRDAVP